MNKLKLRRSADQPHPASPEGDTVVAERGTDDAGEDRDRTTQRDGPAGDPAASGKGAVEGEGSYSAADDYNRATQAFVESHDVEAAAREAEPASPEEAAQLVNAESKGRSRSRGEDGQTPRRRGRFLRRRR